MSRNRNSKDASEVHCTVQLSNQYPFMLYCIVYGIKTKENVQLIFILYQDGRRKSVPLKEPSLLI